MGNLPDDTTATTNSMKKGLKRPIRTYLLHGLWIAVTFYYSTTNNSDFGQWTLRAMTGVGLISLANMLIRKNYFEIANDRLVINRDFFRTKIVDLDRIEKVSIEPGPFSSSRIILKDKTTIKYEDSQTSDKELKEFLGQFNIPVE